MRLRGGWLRELTTFAGLCAVMGVGFAAITRFGEVEVFRYQLSRHDLSNPVFNAMAFAGPYLLGVVSLAALYRYAPRWLRWPALALTAFAVATDVGLRLENGVGFGPHEAAILWREQELVADALRFFVSSAVLGLLAGVAVAAALELVTRLRPPPRTTALVIVLPLVCAGLYNRLLVVTDATVIEFPLPYRAPLLAAYAARYQTHFLGEREAPRIAPRHEPLVEHLVFVMDESVRGDLLHLNGGYPGTTPFLDSLGDRAFNYGVACAAANLSAPANLIVQSGLRPDQIPDRKLRSLRGPNVFAYLARAGFSTAYFNAQGVRNRPPDFMTDRDVAALDGYAELRRLYPDAPEWEIDRHVPKLLADFLRSHPRTFTWVLKSGIHFPYEGKAPHGGDPPERLGRPELSTRQRRVVKSYVGALRWSTDGFLEALMAELQGLPGRILVLYTADHGQSLFERHPGHPEWDDMRGHGFPGPVPPEQARVPLVLIPVDVATRREIAERFDPSRRGRVSSFELFSTFLVLAGYDRADLGGLYVADLFDQDASRPPRRFVSGNHFGAGGPLYRPAPYRTVFDWNDCDPAPSPGGGATQESR